MRTAHPAGGPSTRPQGRPRTEPGHRRHPSATVSSKSRLILSSSHSRTRGHKHGILNACQHVPRTKRNFSIPWPKLGSRCAEPHIAGISWWGGGAYWEQGARGRDARCKGGSRQTPALVQGPTRHVHTGLHKKGQNKTRRRRVLAGPVRFGQKLPSMGLYVHEPQSESTLSVSKLEAQVCGETVCSLPAAGLHAILGDPAVRARGPGCSYTSRHLASVCSRAPLLSTLLALNQQHHQSSGHSGLTLALL